MIRQRDFRKFQAQYHRNGIGGAPFYLCRFMFLRGAAAIELQAIVFDRPGYIAVTSADPRARWRGDDFEPALREAIAAVEKAQPMSMHEYPSGNNPP